jgi:D-serine deaminase-like pyridoxal phosphate-dependent protein
VGEAEIAAGLCDDILIANEVIGRDKCARVAALAKSGIDVKIGVDSEFGLEQVAQAAQDAGTTVGVLVEVNVGFRCGVAPGEPAVALARRAADTAGIELRGLAGYEGHAVGLEDRAQRENAARGAMERLLVSASALREVELPCDIVSAGGTGTYDMTGRTDGVTETNLPRPSTRRSVLNGDQLPAAKPLRRGRGHKCTHNTVAGRSRCRTRA